MDKRHKKCFTCGNIKTLDKFTKLPENDYQLPTDLGVMTNCKNCSYNWIVENEEKLHPYRKITKLQGELRRFTSIAMTQIEAFEYCFNMSDQERKKFTRDKLEEQGLKPYNE